MRIEGEMSPANVSSPLELIQTVRSCGLIDTKVCINEQIGALTIITLSQIDTTSEYDEN